MTAAQIGAKSLSDLNTVLQSSILLKSPLSKSESNPTKVSQNIAHFSSS
jgi:hypothetical protein